MDNEVTLFESTNGMVQGSPYRSFGRIRRRVGNGISEPIHHCAPLMDTWNHLFRLRAVSTMYIRPAHTTLKVCCGAMLSPPLQIHQDAIRDTSAPCFGLPDILIGADSPSEMDTCSERDLMSGLLSAVILVCARCAADDKMNRLKP